MGKRAKKGDKEEENRGSRAERERSYGYGVTLGMGDSVNSGPRG